MVGNALNVFTGMEYHLGWLYTDRGQPYQSTLSLAVQYPLDLKWIAAANYQRASAATQRREGLGAELQYHFSGTDKWIAGLHRSIQPSEAQFLLPGRNTLSVGWRHDWHSGAFSAVQWTHTTSEGSNMADSDALALRVGLQF